MHGAKRSAGQRAPLVSRLTGAIRQKKKRGGIVLSFSILSVRKFSCVCFWIHPRVSRTRISLFSH